MPAGEVAHYLYGLHRVVRLLVNPERRQRVVGVAYRYDLAVGVEDFDGLRVARVVELYVVLVYETAYGLVDAFHPFYDVGAELRVLLYLVPLLGAQAAGLSYYLLRDAGLPDIVQEGCHADRVDLGFAEAHCLAERERHDGDIHGVVVQVVVVVLYHREAEHGVRVGEDRFGHLAYDVGYGPGLGYLAHPHFAHHIFHYVDRAVVYLEDVPPAGRYGLESYAQDTP